MDRNRAAACATAAAWALGAVDPEDAPDFAAHLRWCRDCQAAVADFDDVAEALRQAAPAAEPPVELGAKAVAAVQYAAMTAHRPAPPTRKASRWWHLH